MKRSATEIFEELKAQDEHSTIEAKSSYQTDANETISALSNEPNLGGGYLIFGVRKDERGTYVVSGISDPEKLSSEMANNCNGQTFNTVVRPQIWTDTLDGEQVVVAFIPEARPDDKPVYIRKRGLPKGAYRRIASTDQQCSDVDIRTFHQVAAERPYEDTIAVDATMEDLDEQVITSYRKALIEQNPATEVRDLGLPELVQALGGARAEDSVVRPTVAGVLLFGKRLALRRLFPMHRVDYIRVPGTEWIDDTERRYETVEVREPLLVAFRRVYQAILDDLPKAVEVRADSPERVDTPTVPERVIREALVNALCHRDYRVQSPTQVIRYANRIEFRNAGHSLIAEDLWGQPGSQSRNPRMADVFREMGLAENKGSGIRVMRREMENAKLTLPLFESDRANNRFAARLLFAHLLSDEQRTWLSSLGGEALSREQELALVYCRETGVVRNAIVRDLAGLDTLEASRALTTLRDRGLLELRGSGSTAHYVLTNGSTQAAMPEAPATTTENVAESAGDTAESGQQSLFDDLVGQNSQTQGSGPQTQGSGPQTQGTGPQTQGSGPQTQGSGPQTQGSGADQQAALLGELPGALSVRIKQLGGRPAPAVLREAIREACTVRAFSPKELVSLLSRKDINHLVKNHLTPMVEEGLLERTIPDKPSHPRQAYRSSGPGRDDP